MSGEGDVIREGLKHAKRNASMPHVIAKFDAALAALAALEQERQAALEHLLEFNHVEGEPLDEVAAVAASAYGFTKHRADAAEARAVAAERERDEAIEAKEHAVTSALRNRDARVRAEEALVVTTEHLDEARAIGEELLRHGGDWIVEAANKQLAAAEADAATLRTYILYTPCPSCGLPDPTRVGADCDQCAIARDALAAGAGAETAPWAARAT